MTAAMAVLMAGVATFTACDKDDDKKNNTEKQEQKDDTPQGYVDLGLESGTLWKDQNEFPGFYEFDYAVSKFGNQLPTKVQWEELKVECLWKWTGSGYMVTGPNGNSITLPAAGYRRCDGSTNGVGSGGGYWSSMPDGSDKAWYLYFNSGSVNLYSDRRCYGYFVRLVQK